MQAIHRPAQILEQPATAFAFAQVAFDPTAPARTELSIEIVRHAAPRPPVIPPKAFSIQHATH